MKNSIIFLCAAVVAIGVYYAVMAFEPAGDSQDISSDEIIVIENGEAAKVEQNAKVRKLMDSMDRKAKENRSTDPDKAKRQQEAKEILQGIKSHMANPAPGAYPVKYFTPDDGVPLIADIGKFGTLKPVWLDNTYVVYWAGVSDVYPLKDKSLFSEYKLIVLDVSNGKVVNTIAESNFLGRNCFYLKDKRYLYRLNLSNSSGLKERYFYEGKFNNEFEFILERKSEAYSEENKLYINNTTCQFTSEHKNARNPFKPEDGYVRNVDRKSGRFIHEKPNGESREFSLDFTVGAGFQYDHTRDQYYLGAVFSREDQRSKIWYFDSDFNIVDEFIMPRVRGQQSYPSSFLVGSLSVPLKDGFAMDCGRRGSEDGVTDYDGEPVSHYLCHVKRDQTIVRALKGYPQKYASSPDGCRIFGFISKHKTDVTTGKNFMVDVCD